MSIQTILETQFPAAYCRWHDSLESSNPIALTKAQEHALVIIGADQQRGGRGRRGKSWLTPKGNIALSVAAEITDLKRLQSLPIVAAIAVADTLSRWVPDLGIKWPNDIEVGGAKLAGILVEASTRAALTQVVIGVGLNLSTAPVLGDRTAVRLHDFNPDVGRDEVVLALVTALARCVQGEASLGFVQQYQRFDQLYGQKLQISGDAQYSGIGKGLGAAGQLLVEDETGQLRELWSSSASVRRL